MRLFIIAVIIIICTTSCKKSRLENRCGLGKPLEYDTPDEWLGFPNAFTPNGDGVDDHLVLQHHNIATFHIQVRRNGILVYESRDVNQTWNFRKGDKTLTGIFKYSIEAKTLTNIEIKHESEFCAFDDDDFECMDNAGTLYFSSYFNHGKVFYKNSEAIPECKD